MQISYDIPNIVRILYKTRTKDNRNSSCISGKVSITIHSILYLIIIQSCSKIYLVEFLL